MTMIRDAETPPRAHLRIEKNYGHQVPPGRPHIVTYDRVMAVGADGTEVEISSCVTEWREISAVGAARRVEIVLLGTHLTQEDGTEIYVPPKPQ